MTILKELLSGSNISFSEVLFDIESSANEMDTIVFVSLYIPGSGSQYKI